jgi:hypothetical protein
VAFDINRSPRIAAIGALGVAAGAVALYALLAFISRHTPLGGIDRTEAVVAWISIGVPIAAVVAAHLVYARQLMRLASRQR